MHPEDIDDLFRDKLDGHASPPGDALWARLQAAANAEPNAENPTDASAKRLDQLFQQGLNAHATPARELWERLEDEHLRPRKRRPVAWWPMALAAAVALLIVAGGAGLWLGFPSGSTQLGTVASDPSKGIKSTAGTKSAGLATAATKGSATIAASTKGSTVAQETEVAATNDAAQTADVATNNAAQALKNASSANNQKNITTQATRFTDLASTASKARMAAPRQSPRHPLGTSRTPDAASESAPLVARTTARPASRPALNHALTPTAADEHRSATNPEILVATTPKPASTPEIVPAGAVPAPSVATANALITVDVRNGSNAAARPARTISTALAEATEPEERRGLGGRLLKQAGHLVRGERVSLAEATGLPENMTLRATIAGRSVSKSIQL